MHQAMQVMIHAINSTAWHTFAWLEPPHFGSLPYGSKKQASVHVIVRFDAEYCIQGCKHEPVTKVTFPVVWALKDLNNLRLEFRQR